MKAVQEHLPLRTPTSTNSTKSSLRSVRPEPRFHLTTPQRSVCLSTAQKAKMSAHVPTDSCSLRNRSRPRQASESPPPSFSNLSASPPSWECHRDHRHSDEFVDELFMPRMATATTTVMGGPRGIGSEARPPTPPEGVIMVTTEFTVEGASPNP